MNNEAAPSSDNPAQSEIFPGRIKLRRIDPINNMRRFYLMTLRWYENGAVLAVRES